MFDVTNRSVVVLWSTFVCSSIMGGHHSQFTEEELKDYQVCTSN